MNRTDLPIGVFDSGVGGLTVLAALQRQLPAEDLLYLGDTARVPYGTRAPETVARYARRVAGRLVRRGVKAIVIACNTATTWALPELQAAGARADIPVIGVIEPGVNEALQLTQSGHIAVLGTEGTVRGAVYQTALRTIRPDVEVHAVACPLFVALAEEGWTTGDVARLTAIRYLQPLKNLAQEPDTVILGCTHYPLLSDVIQSVLPKATLVDSATATAAATAARLKRAGLLRPGSARGTASFLVTDHVERFAQVGRRFLNAPPAPVELVDLCEDDEAALVWNMEASA